MENKYLNALLDKKKVEEAVSEKRMGKLPYEHYAHLFKDFEPEDIVSRTGVPFIKDAEGGILDVPLMNDTYRVYWPSGNVDALEGAVPDYKTFVILLRWLENKKAGGARIPQKLSYKEIPAAPTTTAATRDASSSARPSPSRSPRCTRDSNVRRRCWTAESPTRETFGSASAFCRIPT